MFDWIHRRRHEPSPFERRRNFAWVSSWSNPLTVPQDEVETEETIRQLYQLVKLPPYIRTAREAVAWTFGLAGSDYKPGIET